MENLRRYRCKICYSVLILFLTVCGICLGEEAKGLFDDARNVSQAIFELEQGDNVFHRKNNEQQEETGQSIMLPPTDGKLSQFQYTDYIPHATVALLVITNERHVAELLGNYASSVIWGEGVGLLLVLNSKYVLPQLPQNDIGKFVLIPASIGTAIGTGIATATFYIDFMNYSPHNYNLYFNIGLAHTVKGTIAALPGCEKQAPHNIMPYMLVNVVVGAGSILGAQYILHSAYPTDQKYKRLPLSFAMSGALKTTVIIILKQVTPSLVDFTGTDVGIYDVAKETIKGGITGIAVFGATFVLFNTRDVIRSMLNHAHQE